LGLQELALLFLCRGEEDPQLNQELLDLFPDRFDLCAEFKRLYVYRHRLASSLDPVQFASSRKFGAYADLRIAACDRGLARDPTRASCEMELG
jgi:hypothetical protein